MSSTDIKNRKTMMKTLRLMFFASTILALSQHGLLGQDLAALKKEIDQLRERVAALEEQNAKLKSGLETLAAQVRDARATGSPSLSPRPDSTPALPDFSLTAEQLFKEAGENVVAFNLKYKGKAMKVTGPIGRIEAEGVVLWFDQFSSRVICNFDAAAINGLANLKTDGNTTIVGLYKGEAEPVASHVWVTLEKCRLLVAPPPP